VIGEPATLRSISVREPRRLPGADAGARSTPGWLGPLLLATGVRLIFLPIALNNGTDAWARLRIAQAWVEHPRRLPSTVWPPLHFWLLGCALWIWNSEWSARLVTLLFGSLTVLPFWGLMRRAFDRRVAFWSALFFALFGFHIAYSVTTSSEAPTIFFLTLGFYGWALFCHERRWVWLLPSGLGFLGGSLCRYEVWVFIVLLTLLLLDLSHGWHSLWRNRRAWQRAASFGLLSSLGAVGWMAYSWWALGSPLAAARRNAWEASHLQMHQSLPHRLAAVPGALAITLSPLVAVLAIWGIIRVWGRPQVGNNPDRALIVAALLMTGLQVVNSITSDLTMARFTLMYSWLLIPFAFVGLRALCSRWKLPEDGRAFAALLCLFLAWQACVTVGAYWTDHPEIADRLAVVSPALPLPVEIRFLTGWLKRNTSIGDSVVVDQFQYEAADIVRFSGLTLSRCLGVPLPANRSQVETTLSNFLAQQHPHLLVYCTKGQLGRFWPLPDKVDAGLPALGLRLHRLWEGNVYRVYAVGQARDPNNEPGTPSATASKSKTGRIPVRRSPARGL
jgi:Dolichyl-phosphate-mannose-protein mannosyltransferase